MIRLLAVLMVICVQVEAVGSHKKPLLCEKKMLHDWITQTAKRYKFSPRLIRSIIHVESSGKAASVSSRGAVGLMQVKVSTAREIMRNTKITAQQLKDPFLNVEAGTKYLRWLMKQFNGDLDLALTAYNRGIGRVKQDIKNGIDPYNGYKDKVLRS